MRLASWNGETIDYPSEHLALLKNRLRPCDDGWLKLPNIERVVDETGCPVSVYDIETADLPGSLDFGIIELAVLSVIPGRKKSAIRFYCNPGTSISRSVVESTGITNETTRHAPSWSEFGPQVFRWLALRGNRLLGYGNLTFARPCVALACANSRMMNYTEFPSASREIDVFPVVESIYGRKNRSLDAAFSEMTEGNMPEIPENERHGKAFERVVKIAALTDILLEKHGQTMNSVFLDGHFAESIGQPYCYSIKTSEKIVSRVLDPNRFSKTA